MRAAEYGLFDWYIGEDRVYFSDRYCAILGVSHDELDGVDAWLTRVHPDDIDDLRRRFEAHVAGGDPSFIAEYRLRHADGAYRWVRASSWAVRNDVGEAIRIAGSLEDITARKEVVDYLRRHAYHDESTGYPNRHLLLDRLRRAIARREVRGRPFAVAAIGIDAFDKITDSFGHELCESAVTAVADRISELVSPFDTLARIRKDQLCLLSESAPDLTQVMQLAEQLQSAVQQPIQVMGEEVFTTLSIGIVSSDGTTRTPEDYLHDAVVALNRASGGGVGRRAVFDLEMNEEATRRLQLEKELRRAINNEEFTICYQPIISLQTGSVAGFEALLRWDHPERGLLAPGAFIDEAERGGHLSAISDQVLPRILRQVERWQARARDGIHPFVNVNLSRSQFTDPDLLSRVDHALGEVALHPHSLGFEMTESVMVEDGQVIETLRRLKKRNVRLMLDDFGTGYSCLANLRQFPLDAIKIDRSFVVDVGKTPQGGEIARAITTLAHSMAMEVTIEGIETEAQLRFAYTIGCEYAQGFHFSKALTADEAGKLLDQRYRTSLTPPSGKRPRNPQSRGRVLVVDANAARAQTLRDVLQDADIEVVHAVSGHEGARRAEADIPDVVLMSIDLPEMGAEELCRILRRSDDTSTIPILLVTQRSTDEQTLAGCLDAGADDCVLESAPPRVLLARVNTSTKASIAKRKLRNMSMTDEQTGVFTRRFLFQALRRSVKTTVRKAPRGLACLVVDVDDFKHINEARGHIDADGLLQHIASTIDQTTRETDLVARFGGTDFVVMLQDTDHKGARRAAEKIRRAVESSCDTTVSIGGAILPEATIDEVRSERTVDELIADVLRAADKAKYKAKKLGKNRVVFLGDVASQIA